VIVLEQNFKRCLAQDQGCTQCGRELCIHHIPLLESLTDEEASVIAEGVMVHHYKKGEFVFRAGDQASCLYILCVGRTKVVKVTSEGKEQIIYILSPGDFIGAFNLLKADAFLFDMIALEDSQISTLTKASFDQVILNNPQITLKVLEKAYERINKAELLVDRLTTSKLDSRVAGLLITLIDDFGKATRDGILLELSMNREELGSYAGITRESMSRKLSQFQELGWLSLVGAKHILLRDIKALSYCSQTV